MIRTSRDPDKKFLFSLGAITFGGLLLRLHGLWSESFTADEIDTLIRVRSSTSLHQLLDVWVRHDGHPPFVHLLEYFWTKVFGISEGSVRFPFALMGAGATWFAGRTAAKWFSAATGIATAAGTAFLQFPLMYSQLARPYAAGFFFSMATVWFLTCFLFEEEKRKKNLVLFALSALGAVYSHYFSLFFAGLAGFSGLFFLTKKTWKMYLVACGGILLLFLPYFPLFLFQLNAGGVGGPGGWLGPPEPHFFFDHLWFIFDESRIILYGSLLLFLVTAVMFFRRPGKFHALSLFLWAVPLLTGYFYSRKFNPVLQDSVLVFSFPFLLMFLFSFLPNGEKWRFSKFTAPVYTLALLFYVTVYKPFHLTDHFGRLKEIVQSVMDAEKKYGKQNVTCAFNVDYPYYIGYYLDKYNEHPANILTYRNDGKEELRQFRWEMEKASGDYFAYGWSTKFSSPVMLEIIKEKYPYLIERRYWRNSEWYLFSKEPKDSGINADNDILFRTTNECNGITAMQNNLFQAQGGNWLISMEGIPPGDKNAEGWTKAEYHTPSPDPAAPPYVYTWTPVSTPDSSWQHLDSNSPYSSTLLMNVGNCLRSPDNLVIVKSKIRLCDPGAEATIVVEFDRNDSLFKWSGLSSRTQVVNPFAVQEFDFGLYIPADLQKSDRMKVFIYSSNGKPLDVFSMEVETLEGNHVLYGPRKDFQ